MRHNVLTLTFGLLIFFSISCEHREKQSAGSQSIVNTDQQIKHAKRFSIKATERYKILYVFGNRDNKDTTATFVLTRDTLLKSYPGADFVIPIPCEKVAALSSIYATMCYELGALKNLVAIDNIDYVINAAINAKYQQNQLKELSKAPQIDIEQTVVLNPDIVFMFGMGDPKKDIDKRLVSTQIPFALIVDHLEETPLARAEWIKFFAEFLDKREAADSIFDSVENEYKSLKKMVDTTSKKPTVFTEIKYGDLWYIPGGKSYVAQLLEDAGAEYLWKDNTQSGSLTLSFEQVYSTAKQADFWINLSSIKTKKELLDFESRYQAFKAFKNGNLYNNNKFTNTLGYTVYWETGMIYPNRILSDLIGIFHPEIFAKERREMYYYQHIR